MHRAEKGLLNHRKISNALKSTKTAMNNYDDKEHSEESSLFGANTPYSTNTTKNNTFDSTMLPLINNSKNLTNNYTKTNNDPLSKINLNTPESKNSKSKIAVNNSKSLSTMITGEKQNSSTLPKLNESKKLNTKMNEEEQYLNSLNTTEHIRHNNPEHIRHNNPEHIRHNNHTQNSMSRFLSQSVEEHRHNRPTKRRVSFTTFTAMKNGTKNNVEEQKQRLTDEISKYHKEIDSFKTKNALLQKEANNTDNYSYTARSVIEHFQDNSDKGFNTHLDLSANQEIQGKINEVIKNLQAKNETRDDLTLGNLTVAIRENDNKQIKALLENIADQIINVTPTPFMDKTKFVELMVGQISNTNCANLTNLTNNLSATTLLSNEHLKHEINVLQLVHKQIQDNSDKIEELEQSISQNKAIIAKGSLRHNLNRVYTESSISKGDWSMLRDQARAHNKLSLEKKLNNSISKH